jgi:hypothetical protein
LLVSDQFFHRREARAALLGGLLMRSVRTP